MTYPRFWMEPDKPQEAGRGLFTESMLRWLIAQATKWNGDLKRDGDVEFIGFSDGLTTSVEFRSDKGDLTIITLDQMTGCFHMSVNGIDMVRPELN